MVASFSAWRIRMGDRIDYERNAVSVLLCIHRKGLKLTAIVERESNLVLSVLNMSSRKAGILSNTGLKSPHTGTIFPMR